MILIYNRVNFVYHLLGCISIYWPLSYPFRSLNNIVAEVISMRFEGLYYAHEYFIQTGLIILFKKKKTRMHNIFVSIVYDAHMIWQLWCKSAD